MGKVKHSLIEFQDKITIDAIKVIDDLIKDNWNDDDLDVITSDTIKSFKNHKDYNQLKMAYYDEDDMSYAIDEMVREYADHLRSKYADYSEKLNHEE